MPSKRPRLLREPMTVYRIGDPAGKFAIYSGQGAATVEGRWHEIGQAVIYCSHHYSTALVEKLVHHRGRLPPNQHFVKMTIPVGVSYEVVTKDVVPDWAATNGAAARRFGSVWLATARSAILVAPSYVAREEDNVLINPAHPESRHIIPGLETPVWWDTRLFPRPARLKRRR